MAQNRGPSPVIYIVIFLLLAAGGYWFFAKGQGNPPDIGQSDPPDPPPAAPPPAAPPPTAPPPTTPQFSLPNAVAAGTTIRVDGSTSMVTINQNLKNGFQQKFPGTTVTTEAKGSSQGIQGLISGSADIAAVSRPLTESEKSQGLIALPIALDRVAIVVGKDNPFRTGLSKTQVQQIFQGQIVDWSQVGGNSGAIRVINRPPISGTHQTFKEMILGGGEFGSTPNITTMERDATTPLLRELKTDGIGYATYAQVANQQTVRVVAIDGLTGEAATYPFQRKLYYAYKNPPNPAAQYFLGYALSPEGQKAMLGN
ncbi:MAG: phosphate ABC transporter substrate-binding protein [Oscillatoria sp. SIO1A7]|nr:phosphate ABC transporter substrate-binding protein [Oscillatoria sp. SIO1A7]